MFSNNNWIINNNYRRLGRPQFGLQNSREHAKRNSSKFIDNLHTRPQEVSPPLSYWTLRDSMVLSVLPHLRESTIGEVRRTQYSFTLQGAGSRTSKQICHFVCGRVGVGERGQWIMGTFQTAQETVRLKARKEASYKCLLGVVFHGIR